MKYQQGMTTLFITTMLLVAALLFTLSSYKNLFYQIKRTQNEVIARKSHWQAEGGLECGFTLIKNNHLTTDLSECLSILEYPLDDLSVSGSDPPLMTAKAGFKKITKSLVELRGQTTGVIRSTSDLFFDGEHQYYADAVSQDANHRWLCVLIRYKSNLYMSNKVSTSIINTGLKNGHDCHVDYSTDSELVSGFEQDIKFENDVDVFKETFLINREDWLKLRDGNIFSEYIILDPNNCAEELQNKIDIYNRYIWLTGSCFLTAQGITELSLLSQQLDGLFLLIHNGVLSIEAVNANFKGIIYHLNTGFEPFDGGVNAWQLSSAGIATKIDELTMLTAEHALSTPERDRLRSNIVAYIHGNFIPAGGYSFDTPNQLTYFDMTGQIATTGSGYDTEITERLLSVFVTSRWQAGSWHDF